MKTKVIFKEVRANKQSINQRKLVYGIGINDANYKVQPKINGERVCCPFYKVWMDMLRRCFSEKFHEKCHTYKNCTLEKEWLLFSNFKIWMEKQDWQGKHLDKDIINPGNKHYSAKNCVFVSHELNLLLTNCKANRGKYPQGVCFDKKSNNFMAQCRVNTKNKNIGRFDTQEEASQAYIKIKSNHIVEIANHQTDERIKKGLLLHANLLTKEI